jgi:hypothetical protein
MQIIPFKLLEMRLLARWIAYDEDDFSAWCLTSPAATDPVSRLRALLTDID